MDIQFTEEQELLRSSVQRLLRDQYRFRGAPQDRRERRGLEPQAMGGPCRTRPARRAILRGSRRARRRPALDHDHHAGVRPSPRGRAVRGNGRAGGGLIEHVGSEAQQQTFFHESSRAEPSGRWPGPKQSRFDLRRRDDGRRRARLRSQRRKDRRHRRALGGLSDRLRPDLGRARDRGGVSLFVVDRRRPISHLQSFKTIDGRRAAEISFRRRPRQLLGREGEARRSRACRDRAIAALCAEAVGAIGELNSATLEYSKTRKQFGVTLGTFQVLQHRMVDMFIAHQEALSLMQHLPLNRAGAGRHLARLASGAKSKIGYAGTFVADQAVQLHGGMGMSDELECRPLLQATLRHQHPVRRSRLSRAAVRSGCANQLCALADPGNAA